MKKFNLVLDRKHDCSEAIRKLQESLMIYQKKLDMHKQMKTFRRENAHFELHRGRFYRQLSDEASSEHDVGVEAIREF